MKTGLLSTVLLLWMPLAALSAPARPASSPKTPGRSVRTTPSAHGEKTVKPPVSTASRKPAPAPPKAKPAVAKKERPKKDSVKKEPAVSRRNVTTPPARLASRPATKPLTPSSIRKLPASKPVVKTRPSVPKTKPASVPVIGRDLSDRVDISYPPRPGNARPAVKAESPAAKPATPAPKPAAPARKKPVPTGPIPSAEEIPGISPWTETAVAIAPPARAPR